jgi:hypothetical protein
LSVSAKLATQISNLKHPDHGGFTITTFCGINSGYFSLTRTTITIIVAVL